MQPLPRHCSRTTRQLLLIVRNINITVDDRVCAFLYEFVVKIRVNINVPVAVQIKMNRGRNYIIMSESQCRLVLI